MRLDGQFNIAARPEDVYAYLTDPHQVSRQTPDVAAVEIQDEDHFSVTARVGVAHIKGTMVMKLEIRDRHCQHPGCRRPAEECEADHIQPWAWGGPTIQANGRMLCRFHNRWRTGRARSGAETHERGP